MAAYGGEILLLKKSAAVFFLLPGILLVVGGQNEQSSQVIAFGILLCSAVFYSSFLGLSDATKAISPNISLSACQMDVAAPSQEDEPYSILRLVTWVTVYGDCRGCSRRDR